jgi:hypothetical protein
MSTRLITWSTTLVPVTCCECGVLFGVPQDLDRHNYEQGPKRSFWCPSGHEQHYTKSEVQKLREKLAAEQAARERAEAREIHQRDQRLAAERSASAYKGRVTRLKNRAAAGVCPCCNRTFQQLARHMASQHPDFTESADA